MAYHRARRKAQVRKGAGGLRYGFSCSHRDHSTALGLTDGADRLRVHLHLNTDVLQKKGGPQPPCLVVQVFQLVH